MRIVTTTCVLLALLPAISAADGNFRCGSWLVSADSSVAELLRKCGNPTSRQVSTSDVRNEYGIRVGTSTTEIWRYDRGTVAPPMVVTIVDGQIQSIDGGR